MSIQVLGAIQSNYIPWKGYFDFIHESDLFVFYDDVDYTRKDWRNRNKIKTPQGTCWLTIPVRPPVGQLICEVEITDHQWQAEHWKSIRHYYGKAPFFALYQPFFEDFYCYHQWTNLSELNQYLITKIAQDLLGIRTQFADSRSLALQGQKLDRVLDMVRKVNCSTYLIGPAARSYIKTVRFDEIGVALRWKDYSGYPQHPQFFPPFEHGVSILDLLFHTGPEAVDYIWGSRRVRGGEPAQDMQASREER